MNPQVPRGDSWLLRFHVTEGEMVAQTDNNLLALLGETLETAMGAAVARAREAHSTEHFYAFILFTTPLFEYASPSFGTEESLARRAAEAEKRHELRWSPPDWEYCCEGEELFDRANEILGSLLETEGYDEPACGRRRKVFMDVLKRLDGHGIFGTGVTRNSVVVNILWGDQDCVAHVESARELNPFASYLIFARYQLRFLRAWHQEIGHSRSMYKEEGLARIRRSIDRVEEDLRGAKSM